MATKDYISLGNYGVSGDPTNLHSPNQIGGVNTQLPNFNMQGGGLNYGGMMDSFNANTSFMDNLNPGADTPSFLSKLFSGEFGSLASYGEAAQGLGAILEGYNGYQTNKLAGEQLDYTQKLGNANYTNSAIAYNTNAEARARADAAAYGAGSAPARLVNEQLPA